MAEADGVVTRRQNRIQVSNTKKPLFFYVNLAKRFMQQYGEVELSGLGMAIATVVTVVEMLKNNILAIEKKICTSMIDIKDEVRGRPVQKAKIEILLKKSDKFDELMAATDFKRMSSMNVSETGVVETMHRPDMEVMLLVRDEIFTKCRAVDVLRVAASCKRLFNCLRDATFAKLYGKESYDRLLLRLPFMSSYPILVWIDSSWKVFCSTSIDGQVESSDGGYLCYSKSSLFTRRGDLFVSKLMTDTMKLLSGMNQTFKQFPENTRLISPLRTKTTGQSVDLVALVVSDNDQSFQVVVAQPSGLTTEVYDSLTGKWSSHPKLQHVHEGNISVRFGRHVYAHGKIFSVLECCNRVATFRVVDKIWESRLIDLHIGQAPYTLAKHYDMVVGIDGQKNIFFFAQDSKGDVDWHAATPLPHLDGELIGTGCLCLKTGDRKEFIFNDTKWTWVDTQNTSQEIMGEASYITLHSAGLLPSRK